MAEKSVNKKIFVEKGTFVKRGTTLLEAEPFAYVLSEEYRGQLCDTCLLSRKLFRCSGCQWVYYCSRNCQRKAWEVHKVECPNIKKIHPKTLPDSCRMLARIIIKLKNGGSEERGYYSSTEYRTFNDLMSHKKEIEGDMNRMSHLVCVSAVLKEFLPKSILPSFGDILEIYGRMNINSFNILDFDMGTIGGGVYLGPSIVNHSCRENCVTVFEGTKLIMRSLHDVPSFDWSKMTVSYIDNMQTKEARREELLRSYYFLCNCERCMSPEPGAAAAACPNKNCSSPCDPGGFKCVECGQIFPDDFEEDFELAESKSTQILKKMKKMDLTEQLKVGKKLLEIQEGVLHPLNMTHFSVLHKVSIAAIETRNWKEASIYAPNVLQKYQHYLGDYSRLASHMYFLLVTVHFGNGDTKDLGKLIKKCLDVGKVVFGEDHPKLQDILL